MSLRRQMSLEEPPRRRKKFTLFSSGIWPKPRRITATMARQLPVHPPDGLMAEALAGKKNQSTKPTNRVEGRRSRIADEALKAALYLRSILFGRLRGHIINPFTVKGSNFMTTEEMIANLNTIIDNQRVIKENQEIIKANQEKLDALLANQETIQANQSQILANQNEIISMLTR
jgi:hypothetical protein